jgi:O-antigen/teichoic acid export membrane protein
VLFLGVLVYQGGGKMNELWWVSMWVGGTISGVVGMCLDASPWWMLFYVVGGAFAGLYVWLLEFNRRERRKWEAAEYWIKQYRPKD